jgi:predicted nuclease of predicted toxin-antitoxin system
VGASDDAVMAAADTIGSGLVSADTDFGELLALGGRPGPSVVIFRRAPHRPDRQAQLLLRALPDIETHSRKARS